MDRAGVEDGKRAKARRALAQYAEKLYVGAKKRAGVAELLRALHSRLRLWRMCTNEGCRRARACRGDQLRCATQRSRVMLSCLQEAAETRASGGGVAAGRAAADQHAMDCWTEEDGVPIRVQRVIFSWASSEEELERVKKNG
jgi:hypothetical protein